MKSLILASSSPYKQKQLDTLQLNFRTLPPNINETPLPYENAEQTATRLSIEKAKAINTKNSSSLIIGCDQAAELNGKRLHKPLNQSQAIKQLQLCSDNQVRFYSGVALFDTSTHEIKNGVSETCVTFRKLSDEEISSYVNKEYVLDCAGSFKCEALGIGLFSSITSNDPSALIGLPLITLCSLLRDSGINPLLQHS